MYKIDHFSKPDEDAMSHVSAAEARKNLADLVNRVAYGKERVVLTRHGKELCALVPIEELSLLERLRTTVDEMDVDAVRAEAATGETVEWAKLRRELGLTG